MNLGILGATLAFCPILRAVIWLNRLPSERDQRTPDEISEDKHW